MVRADYCKDDTVLIKTKTEQTCVRGRCYDKIVESEVICKEECKNGRCISFIDRAFIYILVIGVVIVLLLVIYVIVKWLILFI